MPSRKISFLIPLGLGLLVLASLLFLWPASQANAQCGSQASSCKNCHEVQGKDPVNNDGTAWHTSHAFGDFCYICHGGNNQSMDETEAHAGMVPPLEDVQAACQSCHPNDLMDRAQVYATALGVQVGTGSGGSGSGGSGTGAPPSGGSGSTGAEGGAPGGAQAGGATGGASASFNQEMVVPNTELVDYNQIYAGRRPVNWGNVLLSLMIGLVAVGGGAYVFVNERKLRGLPPIPGRSQVAKASASPGATAQGTGYSAQISELLPRIAQLSPAGQHALRRLLEDPDQASSLLISLSRLDPELVRRVRSLDHDSRALLLALSGD